jgi:hypothetical protein
MWHHQMEIITNSSWSCWLLNAAVQTRNNGPISGHSNSWWPWQTTWAFLSSRHLTVGIKAAAGSQAPLLYSQKLLPAVSCVTTRNKLWWRFSPLLRSSFSVRTPRLLHVDSWFLLSSSQVLERSRDNLKIQYLALINKLMPQSNEWLMHTNKIL